MQDTRCDKTLNGIQRSILWGGPINRQKDSQSLCAAPTTVPLGQLIFQLGAMTNPVCQQRLYVKQMTNACSGQRFKGDQTVTLTNDQKLSGRYQLVAVPQPGLIDLPGIPGIQEQLPEQNGSLQTKRYPLPTNSQRSKPYVCPYWSCRKSYWRPSYPCFHQRTHRGKSGFGC